MIRAVERSRHDPVHEIATAERQTLHHDGDCVFGSAKRAALRDILRCAAPMA